MVNLYKALLKVQGEIGSIAKDSKNPFFKSSYLSLNGVRDAVLPVLTKHGIVLNQPTVYVDGKSFISTELAHADSGEKLTSLTEVVCSKPGDAQNFGSGMSYSRRYGLMSILCLAADDDDANGAVGRSNEAAMGRKVETSKPVYKEVAKQAQASVDILTVTGVTKVTPVEAVAAITGEKKKVTFNRKPLSTVQVNNDDI